MIIPRPTHKEEESEAANDTSIKPYITQRFLDFWNVPDWKCQCGAVMFGRVKYCIYCKHRLNTHTPRPASYIELSY